MDAVTPRTLTLDDLTREELQEYITFAILFHRQGDLWRARWNAACRKSQAADRRAVEAAERRRQASEAYTAGAPGRKLIALREAYEQARNEFEAAYAAQERAWAAERRAYAGLTACRCDEL